MKRAIALVLIVFLAVGLSACRRDSAPASAPAQGSDTIATQRLPDSAVPSVSLPDFTALVEKAGPAVVTIEAELGASERAVSQQRPAPQGSEDEAMEEFFRRFFGNPNGPGRSGPDEGLPRGPQGGLSFGTGFLISADGYLLTNHHVVDNASKIRVRMSDRREFEAKLVGSDPLSDVALLKVEGKSLPALPLGDSAKLKSGQWVVAIGSPFGFDQSVTAGVVSGTGRRSLDSSQQYVPFIQTDVAINRGNSGGPLLNTRGEVIGVNSQIYSNSGGYMGVSFAIPIETAMNAAQQIRATGKVSRGQLGVEVRDVSREELPELGLEVARGAFVARVQRGSAAEAAGVQAGDVILAFNGRRIETSSDLPPMVGATAPGSKASLSLLRDRRETELAVTLTALDSARLLGQDPAEQAAEPAGGEGLGLRVGPVDAATRSRLRLPQGQGVQVLAVTGLLARQAGLAPGDVVLSVGRTPVGSVADFVRAARAFREGDTVRLRVMNENSTAVIAYPLD